MTRSARWGWTPDVSHPMSTRLPDVRIRRYEPGDAQSLFEAASESIERIFPWLEWCHPGYQLDEASEWIRRCATLWEEDREYNFAIVDRDGRILGGGGRCPHSGRGQ